MKDFNLQRHERMLFALLRASLHGREVEGDGILGASAEDWKRCYQLAARQGVMALAWDGVTRLTEEQMPPKALKITWGMAVEDYEKKYERYCCTLEELTDLYRRHGIATVQLKGVGLSSYYPKPSHREGGDIDVYTWSADPTRMSDREANGLADRLMEEQGIQVDMHSPKHSNFYYKGIPIENHKTFLNVEKYKVAQQADALLARLMAPQLTYLLDGRYRCLTPGADFNRLFVAFHAAQHYGAGLALHHLCDWAVILGRCGGQLPKELTDNALLDGVAAFNRLCNEYLGTSEPVRGGERLAAEMMEEILHPKFDSHGVPVTGKWNILCYKTRRFVHINRVNNRILKWPMWKRVWNSIVLHVHRPETIFQTKAN